MNDLSYCKLITFHLRGTRYGIIRGYAVDIETSKLLLEAVSLLGTTG